MNLEEYFNEKVDDLFEREKYLKDKLKQETDPTKAMWLSMDIQQITYAISIITNTLDNFRDGEI